MDFVALLSGGKDSCYNIFQALQYGHRLVCLANLSPPPEKENEELHSFMYQSAGSSVLPAYAECMGVPLIRRPILGQALDQTLVYEGGNNQDEVEDLYQLLLEVITKYPSIKGVSCGAIVSNYQRFRVENVCQRLGLTCLAYLWQRNRNELIEEIIQDGVDAVLVKVAGAGLEPYKHLGKSLGFLLPTLKKFHEKFGLDMCGEGGEYESLVLDAPFFIKKIELIQSTIELDEEDSSVGMLQVTNWRVVSKDQIMPVSKSLTLPTELSSTLEQISTSTISKEVIIPDQSPLPKLLSNLRVGRDGFGQTPLLFPPKRLFSSEKSSVQTQLKEIMLSLSSTFNQYSISLADICFVHLYISDISLFQAVNEEYCKYFGQYPPSRSCVQSNLPFGIHVALDAIYLANSYKAITTEKQAFTRQVLHIKSMSSWAPQCIGPYAQANLLHDFLVYIAGQIPLDPCTMNLFSSQYDTHASDSLVVWQQELLLSLRHIKRVLNSFDAGLSHSLSCILYLNTSTIQDTSNYVKLLEILCQAMINPSFDEKKSKPTNEPSEEVDDYYEDEEDVKEENNQDNNQVACPIIVIGVPGLPRNANLELEIVGYKPHHLPVNKWQSLDLKKDLTMNRQTQHNDTSFNYELNQIISNVSFPSVSEDSFFSIQIQGRYYPTCLSSAVLHISPSNPNNSQTSQFFYHNDFFQSIVSEIDTFLQLSLMNNLSLRSIRMFVSQNELFFQDLTEKDLIQSLENAWRFVHHTIPSFEIIPMIVDQLTPGIFCSLSIQAIDLYQLESETWIYRFEEK